MSKSEYINASTCFLSRKHYVCFLRISLIIQSQKSAIIQDPPESRAFLLLRKGGNLLANCLNVFSVFTCSSKWCHVIFTVLIMHESQRIYREASCSSFKESEVWLRIKLVWRISELNLKIHKKILKKMTRTMTTYCVLVCFLVLGLLASTSHAFGSQTNLWQGKRSVEEVSY